MIAPIDPALFPLAARARPAGADRPVTLAGPRAWIVATGRMDVFATRMEAGRPAGARAHLFRAGAGAVLLGAGEGGEETGLLAVGAPGTSVLELERGELEDAVSPERGAELLGAWAAHLHAALATPAPQGAATAEVEPGREHALAAGEALAGSHPGAWVRVAEGSAAIGGMETPLASGRVAPLPPGAFLVAGEDGCVARGIDGGEALAEPGGWDAGWDAVERLHAAVLAALAERARAADQAELERIRRRGQAGRAALSGALVRLAGALDPAAEPAAAPGEGNYAVLHAAFRRVAAAGGIALGRASVPAGSPDPLQALARAHRVKVRRVALRGDWWRHDSGPLLGFTTDKRPVALLPVPRGGYRVVDPVEGTDRRVGAAEAAEVSDFAVALYRPFPAERITALGLVRFSLFGSGRDVAMVLATAAAVAVLGMATPLVTAAFFDSVIPGAERGQLVQLVLLLLVAAAAAAVFQAVRALALLRIEARLGAAVQAAVWDRLLSLPLPFFRQWSAGDLATRAMGVEEIRQLLSGPVMGAMLGAAFSLGNFALLFHYDRKLAAVALLLIFAAGLASLAVGALQMRRQRAILALKAKTSGLVLQLLNGISKLRLAGAEAHAFGLWARLFSAQRAEQVRARVLGNGLVLLNVVFPVACSLALFAVAAPRPGDPDALGTGPFLGFMAAFNVCLLAVLAGGQALAGVLAIFPLYEQVRPILHALPEVHAGKKAPGELTGALELRGVTFRYHAEAPAVLRDVSLSVRPGEFVAFVGPSGSGKSTLLRLLLGFEHPESGTVAYDGHDLAGLDVQAVRRQVGVVLQSGRLMAGSVYDNIAGSAPISHDTAWKAAEMAGLADDLKAMPMGMHTVVSDGGGTLSGGQRQRLMIARALVGRPRILLLDEATSALDNRTQAVVAESLAGLKATRVVVAHRLSTVVNADRIYVVDGGRIVESGTYGELMERGGAFHALATRQLV
jgi:NHLM bacteriocin system ABC transporter ATP-binding protein